jgi:hypothetical protein
MSIGFIAGVEETWPRLAPLELVAPAASHQLPRAAAFQRRCREAGCLAGGSRIGVWARGCRRELGSGTAGTRELGSETVAGGGGREHGSGTRELGSGTVRNRELGSGMAAGGGGRELGSGKAGTRELGSGHRELRELFPSRSRRVAEHGGRSLGRRISGTAAAGATGRGGEDEETGEHEAETGEAVKSGGRAAFRSFCFLRRKRDALSQAAREKRRVWCRSAFSGRRSC